MSETGEMCNAVNKIALCQTTSQLPGTLALLLSRRRTLARRSAASTWRNMHGVQVCVLVHEIQRVRAAPLSIQVYDEASSAAVREQCLTLCDVRAVLIEVVCCLDQLQNCQHVSLAKRQVLALQVRAAPLPVTNHTLLSTAHEGAASNVAQPATAGSCVHAPRAQAVLL